MARRAFSRAAGISVFRGATVIVEGSISRRRESYERAVRLPLGGADQSLKETGPPLEIAWRPVFCACWFSEFFSLMF
jgi:hypothetical protein